jgi:hypothetical protein
MDRTQLVARLLGELTTARAAITSSYMRLWRPAERALGDPGADIGPPDPQREREVGAGLVEHPPRDAGSHPRQKAETCP